MIKIIKGNYTVDGAGVKLFRVFSHDTVKLTDPFLLLDHFGSDNPNDYMQGFPWHPHRGIETVTYMNKGDVEHQDNLGHKGIIGKGDVQWMSAGSGIIHQEMPQGKNGMDGFQLWVNMPKSKKMIAPKYREIKSNEIKTIKKDGAQIHVISGEYNCITGPVNNLVIDVTYLDIVLNNSKENKDTEFIFTPKKGYTTLCYVVSGTGNFLSEKVTKNQLAIINDVKTILIKSNNSSKSEDKLRFLLISAKPLQEEIAWGGPIVMNTQAELKEAFRELNNGTFIK